MRCCIDWNSRNEAQTGEMFFFVAPEVEYLGHHLNKEGLKPTEEKVRAIVTKECVRVKCLSKSHKLLWQILTQCVCTSL